jgi:hypothetical protein
MGELASVIEDLIEMLIVGAIALLLMLYLPGLGQKAIAAKLQKWVWYLPTPRASGAATAHHPAPGTSWSSRGPDAPRRELAGDHQAGRRSLEAGIIARVRRPG